MKTTAVSIDFSKHHPIASVKTFSFTASFYFGDWKPHSGIKVVTANSEKNSFLDSQILRQDCPWSRDCPRQLQRQQQQ
jgi:hypothetical protein